MTDAEFRSLVADMRTLQKTYFLTRDYEILKECKAAERKVDNALLCADQKQADDRQLELGL